MTTKRRMSYGEFCETLPQVLDSLTSEEDLVLVERDGQLFKVARVAEREGLDPRLPRVSPERTREALRKSAGALKGVDVDQLKADLRLQRQQDSSGRPG